MKRNLMIAALLVFAPAMLEAQGPRPHPASDPAAVAIYERHANATGGPAPAFQHSIQEMQVPGSPVIRTEILTATPDRVLMRNTVGGEVLIEFGYDGTTGWSSRPGTGVVRVTGQELDAMRASVNTVMTPVIDSTVRLIAGGQRTIDDEPVDVIKYVLADGDTVEAYHATATGLLAGVRMPAIPGAMPEASTILFRDYKQVGGRMVSMTMVMRMGGMEVVSKTVHLSLDPIPIERFRPPAAHVRPN